MIKRDNLLDRVSKTGAKLKSGISELEKENPELLNSTRGRGSFLAVNAINTKVRDDIVAKLKSKGIC